MITISRLEGFYRVGKTGGYARAAADFSYPISQPGVHQQVRRLEEEIGVALLERAARDRMVLTAAGQVLYELVADFFAALPGTLEQMRAQTFSGTLRITSSRLLARGFLAPRIAEFVVEHRGHRIELLDYEDDPLTPLHTHESDLVVEHLTTLPDDLEARQVATLQAFFVLPKAWTTKWKGLRASALKDKPFVSYVADSPEERLQRRALALHDLTPLAAVTASSAEALLSLVGSGVGYSIVPAVRGMGPGDARVRAFAVAHQDAAFPVYAVWRPTSADNPLVRAMLAALDG